MDRRKALKSFAALGIAAFLAPEIPFREYEEEKIHFIGLGGGGTNVLKSIHKKGAQGKFFSINSQKRELPNDIQYIHQESSASLSSEVKSLLAGNKRIVLISCLGGITGTALFKRLNFYLAEHNKKFISVCTLPFSFEGKRRQKIALQTKSELSHLPNIKFLNLKYIEENYGHLTIKDAFFKADEMVYLKMKEGLG